MKEIYYILDEMNIDYRKIELHIGREDILVQKDSFSKLKDNNNFTLEKNEIRFLYGLERPLKYKEKTYIWNNIPCYSLTPNTMIPLDRAIQNKAWILSRTDTEIKYITNDIQMIIDINSVIFGNEEKNEEIVDRIGKNRELFRNNDFLYLLEKVYFKFTGELSDCIFSDGIDDIKDKYITFAEY